MNKVILIGIALSLATACSARKGGGTITTDPANDIDHEPRIDAALSSYDPDQVPGHSDDTAFELCPARLVLTDASGNEYKFPLDTQELQQLSTYEDLALKVKDDSAKYDIALGTEIIQEKIVFRPLDECGGVSFRITQNGQTYENKGRFVFKFDDYLVFNGEASIRMNSNLLVDEISQYFVTTPNSIK